MEWLTEEEIKKAAQGTLLEAAEMSLKHWRQLRDASYEEMMKAMEATDVTVYSPYCALCQYVHNKIGKDIALLKADDCEKHCLLGCVKFGSVWVAAETLWISFHWEQTREKLAFFQNAAAKMCDLISSKIKELKAKEQEEREFEISTSEGGILSIRLLADNKRIEINIDNDYCITVFIKKAKQISEKLSEFIKIAEREQK